MVRPARELAGLIEIRGLGIRRCDFAAEAIVGLVVDLSARRRRAPAAAGGPAGTAFTVLEIPRIPVGPGYRALPLVVAALTTTDEFSFAQPSADCLKGIGNHISPTIATE